MNNNELIKLDYFQLFNLPQTFDLESEILKERLRELQKQHHPDRYAGAGTELLNQALMISSHINQAYSTLMNPLGRALYLLQLRGIIIDLVHETGFSTEFLVEQIEVREEIADAEAAMDIDRLEQIEQALRDKEAALVLKIANFFNHEEFSQIIEPVKQLSFYQKLQQLANHSIARL